MNRFVRAALASTPLWMVVGLANAALGVAIALRVYGSRDVLWVWFWSRNWLDGTNPYFLRIPADYPPWALVAFSPVAIVPDATVPALWACAGVALAIAVAWLGPKAMAVRPPPFLLSIGVLLSWAAVRYGLGNGQFALLAVACGLAAVWLARRGSAWSGVLLAFALMKPHVGVAFLAWAITAAQWRPICGALGAIGAATLVFGARLHESAVSVAAQYVRQTGLELFGPAAVPGTVDVRPLVEGLILAPRVGVFATAALVAAALAAIVWTLKRAPAEERERIALPLFSLWTLTSVFHNAYDLVLLWPVWLALRDRMESEPERTPYLVAFVQLMLVAGIPGFWWKTRLPGASVALHADRLLVVGLLIYFVTTARAAARATSRRPALGQIHGREPIQPAPRHSSEVMLP